MIGSIERYSSSIRKRRASLFWWRVLRVFCLAMLLYLVISRMLVASFRVDSVSMGPGIRPNDKVLASVLSFGPRVPFTNIRLPGPDKPARGDLVVVQPPFFNDGSTLGRIFEPFIDFLTLQKGTLFRDSDGKRSQGFLIKRIIGIPGDTLRMRGFLASIKPRGAIDFLPESQLIGLRYSPQTALSARNWKPELPFSGNAEAIVLGSDEYYVLGDNRPQSSDSRSWGPVTESRILAKVFLRYWPPRDFGKL
jgi:signal peptidase I